MADWRERLEQFVVSGEAYIECSRCRCRIIDEDYDAVIDQAIADKWTARECDVVCGRCKVGRRPNGAVKP